MKIDFHTHGKLAKKLPFSSKYTDWLFRQAKTAGLDAVCLTEHFNTLGFEEVYGYLTKRYEKDGDCFVTDEGFCIFPGMEVDIAEGGHTIVIGPMDCMIEMNRRLEPNKEKEHFLDFVSWYEMTKEYPVFLGAAHPFRTGGHIPELPEEYIRCFSFFDLNGKDLAGDRGYRKKQIEDFAEKFHKPLVAGSDTHQAFQYGCVWNEFKQEIRNVKELEENIQKKAYEICISDHLELQVDAAGRLKHSLKEIHKLGGDYVTVLLEGAKAKKGC